jgi:hypothetical protein
MPARENMLAKLEKIRKIEIQRVIVFTHSDMILFAHDYANSLPLLKNNKKLSTSQW